MIHELVSLNTHTLSKNYLIKHFKQILDENREVAESLLLSLSRNRPELFEELFKGFVETSKIELSSFEVVFSLITRVTISQKHLDTFIDRCLSSCQKLSGPAQTKLLKSVCKFICQLIRKGYFDVTNKPELWLTHCSQFKNNKHIAEFRDLINEKIKD